MRVYPFVFDRLLCRICGDSSVLIVRTQEDECLYAIQYAIYGSWYSGGDSGCCGYYLD